MNDRLLEGALRRYRERERIRADRKRRSRPGAVLEWDADWRIDLRLRRLGHDREEARAVLDEGGNSTSGTLDLERLLGLTEELGVEFLDQAGDAARCVGRVRSIDPATGEDRVAAGVLISPRLLLTTAAVAPNSRVADSARVEFGDRYDRDGLIRAPRVFRLEPETFFHADPALGFAVVAVEETNAEGRDLGRRGYATLIEDEGGLLVGERLSIVDPTERDRQRLSIRTRRVIDRVESYCHHEADSPAPLPGAPMFNDQWELVAIHTTPLPSVGGTAQRERAGEALLISEVARVLKLRLMSADPDPILLEAFDPLLDPHVRDDDPDDDRRALPTLRLEPDDDHSIQSGEFAPATSLRESAKPSDRAESSVTIPLRIRLTWPDQPARESIRPISKAAGTPRPLRLVDSERNRVAAPIPRPEPVRRRISESSRGRDPFDRYRGVRGNLSPVRLFHRLRDLLRTGESSVEDRPLDFETLLAIDRHPDGEIRDVCTGRRLEIRSAIEGDRAAMESRRQLLARAIREGASADPESIRALAAGIERDHPAWRMIAWPGVPSAATSSARRDPLLWFVARPGAVAFRGDRRLGPAVPFAPGVESSPEWGIRDPSTFEPIAGRGPLARAILYALLRHPEARAALDPAEFPALLDAWIRWHQREPVTEHERRRNDAADELRGLRNPFVDHPEWVVRVDFRPEPEPEPAREPGFVR